MSMSCLEILGSNKASLYRPKARSILRYVVFVNDTDCAVLRSILLLLPFEKLIFSLLHKSLLNNCLVFGKCTPLSSGKQDKYTNMFMVLR